MIALITGGSSGIGLSIAKRLKELGYNIILVARDIEKLEKAKLEVGENTEVIALDISSLKNCKELYKQVKDKDIDIVVNSAGFGLYGKFLEQNIEEQLDMIDLNVKTTQIITKLFLTDFKEKNHGYILNIASTAAFSPGPLMACYFATKAYVLRLTEAISEEIRQEKSRVYVGCLCPGPVDTHFNDKLSVQFSKAQNSDELATYAVQKMFQRKTVIIPTWKHKLNTFFNKFVPTKILLRANYNIQIKKINNTKKE